MESFVVSARKYRPSTFDSVVGQAHITTTLKNAIGQNHLAQAFLFCGPRGVGKTTCARILAKTINCQNLSAEREACNHCESCVSFNQSSSFNIHELDAASNNSVDDIRNLVDQVRYPPQSGKYKIYIIDEVHMLSNAAFNAFLKTLEEPPSYAIFILATTEKHKIIPTILSRCQIFDFNRIQIQDIAGHLARIAQKENIRTDEEALQLIAQKADGGLRDALSMFDLIVTFSQDRSITYQNTIANLHILDYDYYFAMTDALLAQHVSKAFLLFDEILRKGFDGHNFLVGLCEHFRNLMVCKDEATLQLLPVSGDTRRKYFRQAQQASLSFLVTALTIGSQCDVNYKASKNQRLHVELALTKMAFIPAAVYLAKQPVNGSADAKKKPDEPAPSNGHATNGTSETSVAESVPVTAAVPVPETKSNGNGNRYTPTAAARPTVRLTTPSLNSPAEKPTNGTTDVAEPDEESQPFTLADVQACWQSFADSRKPISGFSSEQVILSKPFELTEQTILLRLDNRTQMDQLGELKAELLLYLRKNLRNRHVQLQVDLAPPETKKMIYTSQEKFRHLAEKHPTLIYLQTQLGLDVDS